MKPLIFVLLFVFGLWCYGSAHWYVCNIKYLCQGDGLAVAIEPADSNESQEPTVEPVKGKKVIEEVDSAKVETSNEPANDFEIERLDEKIIIHFPVASANPETNKRLNEYFDKLALNLEKTGKKVLVTGHTDNTGLSEANLKLGMKRAEAIKRMMEYKGIDSSRLSIASKGEAEPMVSNDSEEGRNKNRRVELTLY